MAHTSCMLDKQGYMHTGACKRPSAPTHTHTHTHTQIRNNYCFSAKKNSYVNAPQYYVTRTLRVLCVFNDTIPYLTLCTVLEFLTITESSFTAHAVISLTCPCEPNLAAPDSLAFFAHKNIHISIFCYDRKL